MLLSVALGLFFAVGKSSSICPDVGKTPPTNGGVNNFYIQELELSTKIQIAFPFAIGQCTTHMIDKVGSFYIHTCTDQNIISTQEYTDYTCSTTVGSPVLSMTADNYNAGEVGYFECGGDSTYALLYISTGAQGDIACGTGGQQNVYAGLKGCIDDISWLGQMLSIYCDSSQAVLEWYSDLQVITGRDDLEMISSSQSPITPSTTLSSNACDGKYYCNDWAIPAGKIGTCYNITSLPNNWLWGAMLKCTGTPSTSKDATTAIVTLWTGLVAVIAALAL
jgi:hypothetical protein